MKSNLKPNRASLTFFATSLILITLLITLATALAISTEVLQFRDSSVTLDASLLSWRIGGYVTVEQCGPTMHYGFNGPHLPTTGDGLIIDLWCAKAIVRQSDQRPLLFW